MDRRSVVGLYKWQSQVNKTLRRINKLITDILRSPFAGDRNKNSIVFGKGFGEEPFFRKVFPEKEPPIQGWQLGNASFHQSQSRFLKKAPQKLLKRRASLALLTSTITGLNSHGSF